jgi:hypothetical protein
MRTVALFATLLTSCVEFAQVLLATQTAPVKWVHGESHNSIVESGQGRCREIQRPLSVSDMRTALVRTLQR